MRDLTNIGGIFVSLDEDKQFLIGEEQFSSVKYDLKEFYIYLLLRALVELEPKTPDLRLY